MRFLFLVCACLITAGASAQMKHKKRKSTAAGTLFFYWGYNRSWYTGSDLRLAGQDYDFTLKGASAHDHPDKFGSAYFNPVTGPQFVGRAGYYFKDKWAISLGVDHFRYVFDNGNNVLLNGFIGNGVDANWSGNYSDESITTDSMQFHYENRNSFIRLEVMRSYDILEVGRYRELVITANIGGGAGPVVSSNTLNFGQERTYSTTSLSGYGLAANGSLRFEFFKHAFIQANTGFGMMHLTHVRTREQDRNQYARQLYGYFTYDISVGLLFYLRPKNACDSCPHW